MERAKVEEDLRSQVVTLETANTVLEERVAGLDQAVNTMQTHLKTTEDALNKQVQRLIYSPKCRIFNATIRNQSGLHFTKFILTSLQINEGKERESELQNTVDEKNNKVDDLENKVKVRSEKHWEQILKQMDWVKYR